MTSDWLACPFQEQQLRQDNDAEDGKENDEDEEADVGAFFGAGGRVRAPPHRDDSVSLARGRKRARGARLENRQSATHARASATASRDTTHTRASATALTHRTSARALLTARHNYSELSHEVASSFQRFYPLQALHSFYD
ncbi:hypothetical protein O0L34_g4851 [Tuta absoluta]|nr:hypothetical protein O0L34_g4851 [Tuta absoluta]